MTCATDLHDVSRCPHGHRCEACGAEHHLLAPRAVETPAGVVCVTVCPGCSGGLARGAELAITAGTAGRLAEQHREHLARPRIP